MMCKSFLVFCLILQIVVPEVGTSCNEKEISLINLINIIDSLEVSSELKSLLEIIYKLDTPVYVQDCFYNYPTYNNSFSRYEVDTGDQYYSILNIDLNIINSEFISKAQFRGFYAMTSCLNSRLNVKSQNNMIDFIKINSKWLPSLLIENFRLTQLSWSPSVIKQIMCILVHGFDSKYELPFHTKNVSKCFFFQHGIHKEDLVTDNLNYDIFMNDLYGNLDIFVNTLQFKNANPKSEKEAYNKTLNDNMYKNITIGDNLSSLCLIVNLTFTSKIVKHYFRDDFERRNEYKNTLESINDELSNNNTEYIYDVLQNYIKKDKHVQKKADPVYVPPKPNDFNSSDTSSSKNADGVNNYYNDDDNGDWSRNSRSIKRIIYASVPCSEGQRYVVQLNVSSLMVVFTESTPKALLQWFQSAVPLIEDFPFYDYNFSIDMVTDILLTLLHSSTNIVVKRNVNNLFNDIDVTQPNYASPEFLIECRNEFDVKFGTVKVKLSSNDYFFMEFI